VEILEAIADLLGGYARITGEMAPYLLFGFLVAGLLAVLISPELVERHLGGRGFGPVFKAAVFGVPLPLCSCGVIPVAASLRRHGAGKGATTSFLLSTPQTGVDSVLVTFSLLGPVFAIFRPLAAFITGIAGGTVVNLFESDGEAGRDGAQECDCQSCSTVNDKGGRLARALRYGFVSLPRDIAKPLLFGLVIAGTISAVVPEGYFSDVFGTGILSMLAMMVVGIPLYVCATASVPIAASLIVAGISPGAALVFLMTGPATNAATVATVWKILGRRTAVVYLVTVALSALAAGALINHLIPAGAASEMFTAPWMLPGWFTTTAALVLLAVLARALFSSSHVAHGEADGSSPDTGPSTRFHVTGMTCTHCANAVRRALVECPGVSRAEVSLAAGEAVVTGESLDFAALRAAVTAVGYDLERT